MCRIAAKALDENRLVEGVIDFVPSLSKEEIKNWIKKHGVEGLMPQKWVPLCKRAKNPVEFVKSFRFVIRDTFGMERAQVTAGGVPVEEVVQDSMESKRKNSCIFWVNFWMWMEFVAAITCILHGVPQ